MRIVAAMMRHDYGVKERGESYEYVNVYLPLCDVFGADNVLLFDFFDEHARLGRRAMNERFRELVVREKPDAVLVCLFKDELDPLVVSELRRHTRTVAYFFDDPWRQTYVREWIPRFDFFTTPDHYTYRRYLSEGLESAIYCPFGFNAKVYRKLDLEKLYDVSFVGGQSPTRAWIVHRLRRAGFRVEVFGRGWEGGRAWLGQDAMVEVFNRSRINLNLSNARANDVDFHLWSLRSWSAARRNATLGKTREQVKGRHYEINGCGGFQLSYFVPGLNVAYELDREIVAFDDVRTIPELVTLFLRDEALREEIAARGHDRSLRDHTAQGYLRRALTRVVGEGAEP